MLDGGVCGVSGGRELMSGWLLDAQFFTSWHWLFRLPRFAALPDRTRSPLRPQVPGRSIPVAAGVDGGLGERLLRMLDEQIACRVRLSQVCASQQFTCNCSSGVWANVRLRLRGRSCHTLFPLRSLTVFAFPAALQARILLPEEIPLKEGRS